MKMIALWDIMSLMMEALSTSETSVNFYEATRHNIPEGCHLQITTPSSQLAIIPLALVMMCSGCVQLQVIYLNITP
jgi:hypothetical protein